MRSKTSIYGVDTTIDKNIDTIITNDVRRMIGIEKDQDIVITYNEEPKSLIRKSRGLNGVHSNNTSPTFRINVESSELSEEDLAMVSAPHSKNTYPIFRDAEIGVSIYPLKQSRKRVYTMTIFHKSKQFLTALKDKLTLLPMQYTQVRYHKLEYFFAIPENVLYMLDSFRVLKNKELYDYEEKLELIPYLNKYGQKGLDAILSNKMYPYKSEVVYRESVSNVIGRITSELYELTVDKEEDYFTISLDYEIWYEKPIMLIIEYPLMIFNNHIHQAYSKTYSHPYRYVPKYGKSGKLWKGGYNIFNNLNKIHLDSRNYIIHPRYDEKINIQKYNGYLTLCQILLQVDNNYDICNVFNLPCITFKKSFRDYIKTFTNINTKLYNGLFLFELYRNGKRVTDINLTLDEEGNLKSDLPLRKRFTFHLVISILTDFTYLIENTKKDLLSYFRINVKDKPKLPIEKNQFKGSPFHKDKETYYVDNFGNLINEEGYVCYIDGDKVIDEESGSYVKGGDKLGVFNGDVETGCYIDSEGKFINPDGLPIDEEGNILTDENGEPLEASTPSFIWAEDVEDETEYVMSDYLKEKKQKNEIFYENNNGVNIKKIDDGVYENCLARDWLDMIGIQNIDNMNGKEVLNALTSITNINRSYPRIIQTFTTEIHRKG